MHSKLSKADTRSSRVFRERFSRWKEWNKKTNEMWEPSLGTYHLWELAVKRIELLIRDIQWSVYGETGLSEKFEYFVFKMTSESRWPVLTFGKSRGCPFKKVSVLQKCLLREFTISGTWTAVRRDSHTVMECTCCQLHGKGTVMVPSFYHIWFDYISLMPFLFLWL